MRNPESYIMWNDMLLFGKRIEIKFAIKGACAAGFAVLLGEYVSFLFKRDKAEIIIGGLWTSMTAIISSQFHLGSSFRAAGNRLLGTFIGAAIGGLFAFFFGSFPLYFSIAIFFTFLICTFLNIQSSLPLSGSTVAIIMIMGNLHAGTNAFQFAFFRMLDAIMGVLVAILIAYLVWPEKASKKMQEHMAKIFTALGALYQAISAKQTTLEENEKLNLMKQTQGMLQKNRLFLEDAKLEFLMSMGKADEWENLHLRLLRIFDTLRSLSKINWLTEYYSIEKLNKIVSDTKTQLDIFAKYMSEKALRIDLDAKHKQISDLKDEISQINLDFLPKALQIKDTNFFILLHMHTIIYEELEESIKDMKLLK